MTTVNLLEIANAIEQLEAKEYEIQCLEDNLNDANEAFDEQLRKLIENPDYAVFISLADRLKNIKDRGIVYADETFPVDEPVENWEAKDEPIKSDEEFRRVLVEALDDAEKEFAKKDFPANRGVYPPSDEAFATAFSGLPSGVSDASGHYPTGQEPDATTELSNEPEAATVGDETADAENQQSGLL